MAETSRHVEIALVGAACATVAWSLETAAQAQLRLEAGGLVAQAALVIGVLSRRKMVLPRAWLEASRTCPDAGVVYVLMGPLLSAALLLVFANAQASSFRAEDQMQYARAFFWAVAACTMRFQTCIVPWGPPGFAASFTADCLMAVVSGSLWLLGSAGGGTLRGASWCGALSLGVLLVYRGLVAIWLLAFHRSFTIGEAYCVVLAVSVATVDFFLLTLERTGAPQLRLPFGALDERSNPWVALQGGLLGVMSLPLVLGGFLTRYAILDNETISVNARIDPLASAAFPRSLRAPAAAPLFSWDRQALPPSALAVFLGALAVWLAGVVSAWAAFLLGGQHPILFVRDYTFSTSVHTGILAFWVTALGLGLPLIHVVASRAGWPLIITRKLYHLLALAMFGPPITIAPDFMALSFGIAMALLIVVEVIRICRIPPLGAWIHAFLRSYTDSRDEGTTILTHIYLLLGCAVPLWLFTGIDAPAASRARLAGVAILGAGDAAGAIVGSQLGSHFWPGGRKTIEGTAAAVTTSMLVIWALEVAQGGSATLGGWLVVLLATVLTCLVEAFTKQIDNLTLPVLYAALLALPRLPLPFLGEPTSAA